MNEFYESKNMKKEEVNNSKNRIVWIFIAVIIIIAIAGVAFLLNGSTTTSGANPEPETNESLICEAENLSYPIFTYDNSTRKTTKITTIFDNDKINSISLVQIMYYDIAANIVASEAQNHAAMNISFGKDGLGADSYNARYTKLDDSMRMTLYADSSSVNTAAYKYFLINTEEFDIGMDDLKSIYNKQGFICRQI